jgi:hypothetical protein
VIKKFWRKIVFNKIYVQNTWGNEESVSGNGSSLKQTYTLRTELSDFFFTHEIKSLADIPCGDFNWMSQIDLSKITYIGCDVSSKLIHSLNRQYATNNLTFKVADICRDRIPSSDVVFVRDCLVHLSLKDSLKAIRNLLRSEFKYMCFTTFTATLLNKDVFGGFEWRPLNLEIAPFNFPKPYLLINEKCSEANFKFTDKCIGIWKKEQLFGVL